MPSVYLKTRHAPWVAYKVYTASGPVLGATDRKGGNVPPDAYVIPEQMNNLELRAAATVTGKTCTATCYGARWKSKKNQTFDDVSVIGSAVLISGTQVATNQSLYAHSVILTDNWITEVHVADGNANNGMSRIAFDTSGYDVFFVILNYADDTDWQVDISGW